MTKGLVDVQFEIPVAMERKLRKGITREQVEELFKRIDRLLFGKKGELADMIRSQKGKDGKTWPDLSERYLAWKKRMMQSGRPIPGEKIAPKTVISTKKWIRTGKMLAIVEHSGTWGLKKLVIYPKNFFKAGGTVMEVFIEKLHHWQYVHGGTKKMPARPLFFFTRDVIKEIHVVAQEWLTQITGLIFPKGSVKVG